MNSNSKKWVSPSKRPICRAVLCGRHGLGMRCLYAQIDFRGRVVCVGVVPILECVGRLLGNFRQLEHARVMLLCFLVPRQEGNGPLLLDQRTTSPGRRLGWLCGCQFPGCERRVEVLDEGSEHRNALNNNRAGDFGGVPGAQVSTFAVVSRGIDVTGSACADKSNIRHGGRPRGKGGGVSAATLLKQDMTDQISDMASRHMYHLSWTCIRGVSFHQVLTAVMTATKIPRLKVTQRAIFSAFLRLSRHVINHGNRAKTKSMMIL